LKVVRLPASLIWHRICNRTLRPRLAGWVAPPSLAEHRKRGRVSDSASLQTLILGDGRTLAYAEYGETTGMPVIAFHGMPGSRLVMKVAEDAALAAQARIIAPDRPGYGYSQANKRGTLLSYVEDVLQLADALKIDQFAVLGISGGGPYPLACAYKIPQRVTVAALISGIGSLNLPHSTHGMMRTNKIMFVLGRLSPALAGLLLPQLIRSSLPSMEQHVRNGKSSSPDLTSDVFAIMTADQREAIRSGGQGIIFDMKVLWQPLGFNFEDVYTKVYLWHGAADDLAPAHLAHHIADRLSNCEATFYPEEDHTGPLTKHINEIMEKIVSDSRMA
jgi:pimeloyl-ACP methyl ester carboxylesterase